MICLDKTQGNPLAKIPPSQEYRQPEKITLSVYPTVQLVQPQGPAHRDTDINVGKTSDYENSSTPRPPTLVTALFYSAHFYEFIDLTYLSPSPKLQNPPEGKVFELFRSKVGDFRQRTYVASAPIYIGPDHPHQFSDFLRVSTAQPHDFRIVSTEALPTT